MSGSTRAMATRQAGAVAMRTDDMDTLTVAKMLAESGFFGEVRDAGKALAKILAGQELGMGPIASLMGVYYQQGKVTYSANIMAAAVKKSGQYTYRVRHLDDDGCTVEFFERSGGAWEPVGTSAFTRDDARKAGLLDGPNKHNWSKFPRNMMFARAMSNGAKWYTPDVFGGVTPYTPDELGAEVVVGDDGEIKPVRADITDVTPYPPGSRGERMMERANARRVAENGTVVKANDGPVGDVDPVVEARAQQFERSWARGAARAQEIGADVPEMPDPRTKSKEELQAALSAFGAAIAERKVFLAGERLKMLTTEAQQLGIDVEVLDPTTMAPEDLAGTVQALQEMIDNTKGAQESQAAEGDDDGWADA